MFLNTVRRKTPRRPRCGDEKQRRRSEADSAKSLSLSCLLHSTIDTWYLLSASGSAETLLRSRADHEPVPAMRLPACSSWR